MKNYLPYLITVCLTVILITLIFNVSSCHRSTRDRNERVLTECLKQGKDPLLCRTLLEVEAR